MSAALIEVWQRLVRRRRIGVLCISTVLVMLLVARGTGRLSDVVHLTAAPAIATPLISAQVGRLLATSLCLTLQGWLILLAPLLAVTAYTVTPSRITSSLTLLLIRLLAVWGMMMIVISLSLPFFSLLPLFGSLSLPEIGWAFAVIVTTALLSGAHSMTWVTVTRNPPAALVLAYGVLSLWLLVGVLIAITRSTPSTMVVVTVAFNPFAALLSPLAPAFPPDGPIAADLATLLQFTHGAIARTTPLYRLYVIGSGLLIFIFVAIANIVSRSQPRRWERFDTLFSALGVVYLAVLWFWRDWWMVVLLSGAQ